MTPLAGSQFPLKSLFGGAIRDNELRHGNKQHGSEGGLHIPMSESFLPPAVV